jgi:hypothetical protein
VPHLLCHGVSAFSDPFPIESPLFTSKEFRGHILTQILKRAVDRFGLIVWLEKLSQTQTQLLYQEQHIAFPLHAKSKLSYKPSIIIYYNALGQRLLVLLYTYSKKKDKKTINLELLNLFGYQQPKGRTGVKQIYKFYK